MNGFTLGCVLTSAAEVVRLETMLLQLSAVHFYIPCIRRNCGLFLSVEAMLLSLGNKCCVPGIQPGVE